MSAEGGVRCMGKDAQRQKGEGKGMGAQQGPSPCKGCAWEELQHFRRVTCLAAVHEFCCGV